MKNLLKTTVTIAAAMIVAMTPVNARETSHTTPNASESLTNVLNIGNTSDGSEGTLSISNYSAKLYAGSNQSIVDAEDSAAYMVWGKKVLIADHAYQGFRIIRTLSAGATGTITDNAGTTLLTMVSSYQGINTGNGINLLDGRYAENVNDGNYILYTCNDSEGVSVTVTYWNTTEVSLQPIEEPVVSAGGTAMYRLYNRNSGEHFYTASAGERDSLRAAGWSYEGVGWTAPITGNPVYRVYNPNSGLHHYTMETSERNYLISIGWSYEGIGWYSDVNKTVPIYRQYNPNSGIHNYSVDASENNFLVAAGWYAEGNGWYGIN